MGPLISLRGSGPWQGKSTRQVSDRGERRLRKLVNGYVSGDGHEIRSRPGWHTICDLTADNNSNGFERRVPDSRRGIYDWSVSTSSYQYPIRQTQQTILSFARPTFLHCFEQIRDRLLIVGESDFRKNPIYGSPRTEITIVGLYYTTSWNLQVSSTPVIHSLSDTGNAGGNGIAVGDVVYVELDSTTSTISPVAFAEVDNFFAVVTAVVADTTTPAGGRAFITLATTGASGVLGSPHNAVGRVWRTRCNRSDLYPVSPEEPIDYKQIDDPDALTVWTVPQGLDLDNPCGMVAEPAWVANRQRDHGDTENIPTLTTPMMLEGPQITPTSFLRGVSRRRQKRLPYRVNPENAGNRLVLAVPGYGCLFQCPVLIPIAGEFLASSSGWSPNAGDGVVSWFNDLHDKPRCLGLPKAWLIDSIVTPAPTGTPTDSWTKPYNFIAYSIAASGAGWPAGTYRFAITYFDDYTGEESLASEEVSITLASATPSQGFSYGLQLTYMIPGYWFPETLAFSLNIYLATNSTEPLAFYKRVPLSEAPVSTPTLSAKYGTRGGTSAIGTPEDTNQYLWRTIQLPAPINTTPISAARDATRLAPQGLQMHRGAECFAQIRGVGFSVGHSGTHGKAKELQYGTMSAVFNFTTPNYHPSENEVFIQGANTPVIDLSTPTNPLDGSYGIASRYMPPAYEGVDLFSSDLFPAPKQKISMGLMLNSKTHNLGSIFDRFMAYQQRIAMDEKLFDKDKGAAGSPYPQTRTNKETYLIEPKGQLQVSEPGRIEVAQAEAIQFMDPQKDDDGIAIGSFGEGAIICTRQETFSLRWYRHPRGEIPVLISSDHGCIATNSMVSYDGGLAWLGDRGPVAMTGEGLKWVGEQLEHDFRGDASRYARDERKLMRHSFGTYDKGRGLVYWGLVTKDATHTIRWNRATTAYSSTESQGQSRFPCNEILVWSPTTGAFSTWEMPSGLEVWWMAPLKDKNGDVWMCMGCNDNRIYALDDAWQDTNRTIFSSTIASVGTAATSCVIADAFAVDGNGGATARGTGENLLRVGMSVLIINPDGQVAAKTTVSSLTVATKTIGLTDASTWELNATIEVGHRPDMRVVTAYAGDGPDNLDIEAVSVRYSLYGEGETAFARVNAIKSDLRDASVEVGYTEQPSDWEKLGTAESPPYGARREIAQGRAVGPELSVDITFTGAAQVRMADLGLKVAQ